MACRAPGLVLGINLERLNTPLVDFVPVLRIPNRPRRRPRPRLFPGGTSKTYAACFLAFPFLPSSRSASVFDHQSTTRTIRREVQPPGNPPGRCSPCKGRQRAVENGWRLPPWHMMCPILTMTSSMLQLPAKRSKERVVFRIARNAD
jgi:hypothetical protein